MSILETVLVFVAIPAGIYAVIAGLSFLGKPLAGEHPKHYDLAAKWTHEPVLWSAVDEVTASGGHGGGHAAIESGADLIGGRANGTW